MESEISSSFRLKNVSQKGHFAKISSRLDYCIRLIRRLTKIDKKAVVAVAVLVKQCQGNKKDVQNCFGASSAFMHTVCRVIMVSERKKNQITRLPHSLTTQLHRQVVFLLSQDGRLI